MEKPILIYDTDMDTDCDDAGAIAMLLQAHLAGKIELIGVAADSVSPYAAPCCEVLTRYYGVDVPIGTIYADDYQDSEENIARFAEYRGHSRGCIDRRMAYNLTFAEEIGKKDSGPAVQNSVVAGS